MPEVADIYIQPSNPEEILPGVEAVFDVNIMNVGSYYDPLDVYFTLYRVGQTDVLRSNTNSFSAGEITKIDTGRYRYVLPSSVTSTLAGGKYKVRWVIET